MPTNSESVLQLEIGHVLFVDIVGYSKLLINEQSERIQELTEIVRGTEQFRLAEAEAKLMRLPTGDGGALVFRTSPEAPVLCALEISKALKEHPALHVRMGIHSGPVNEVADLNEQVNMAGAGVNIAQRVMNCGDAGHILLSKHAAEDLGEYGNGNSSCMTWASATSNTAAAFMSSISTLGKWVIRKCRLNSGRQSRSGDGH
jgi:class 3 adenylate cyclase